MLKKLFFKKKILKLIYIPTLTFFLVGCNFKNVGICHFDQKIDDLSAWDNFLKNDFNGDIANKTPIKDGYTGIIFVGASFCPFCHAMLDLDPNAYSSMKSYWNKYASDDETKLQKWFDKNTETWNGPLNQAVYTMKTILEDPKINIKYKASYIDVGGYKIGESISSKDSDQPNNWTLGLKPKYNFLGQLVNYLQKNDTTLYYQFSNGSLKKQNNYNFEIPITVYVNESVITGFSAGYLDYDDVFNCLNQMLNL